MDMTFKSAVIISLFIHSIIIVPLYNIAIPKTRTEVRKAITIEYIKLKEPVKVDIVQKKETRLIETQKLEIAKPVDMKPPIDTIIDGVAKKEAQIKTTKDYINYFHLIREKIRQRLRAKYKNYYSEGDVDLTFALNADGSLISVDADRPSSTSDMRVLDIAISGVKEASPFPPFPKALTLPKMNFNLAISFKRE